MWRDQMQQGSFRGVAFGVASQSTQGGRRLVQHEYPGRDLPWVEDMGRKVRQHSIDMLFVGADYMTPRDAMLDALEQAASAELIHPWLGRMMVAVEQYQLSESTAQGGFCTISVGFVEAGEQQFPTVQKNTAAAVAQQSDNAAAAVQQNFTQHYTTATLASWVRDTAIADVQAITASMQALVESAPVLPAALLDFQQAVVTMANTADTLVQTPLLLANQLGNVIASLVSVFADPLRGLRAYDGLMAWESRTPLSPTTPSRRTDRINHDALVAMVQQYAVIEAVRASSNTVPASSSEAIILRDHLAAQLDAVMATASDSVYAALIQLYATMVDDLTNRAAQLPMLDYTTVAISEPTLKIAQRLWADAKRANELKVRNPIIIRHPLFVPAGIALEYHHG